MAAGTISVGGSTRKLKTNSLHVVEGINGRSTLRAGIVSLDGSYIPDTDDEVVLEDDSSNMLFKGVVTEPEEEWQAQGDAVITMITAEDNSALAGRRRVKASTTGGISGRDAIDYLVDNYLATYGVTRDTSMPEGATLGALSYDYATVTEVLNDIVRLAASESWLWRIDEDKVLKAWEPGASALPCPWSISASSPKIVGDIKITRSRDKYANKVILVYGDGTSTPATVTAEDEDEQTAHGIYEVAIQAAGPFDETTAQAVADAYLAQLLVRPRQIKFRTQEAGARAGQTLSVNLPVRNLNADFLITEVETTDFDGVHLFFDITAIEGGQFASSWKDTYRAWSGSGSSGVVQVGGASIVTSVVGRASYFLGGSGIAGQQSAGPSVINAVGYIDVMLDSTALPGGTSVTAVVQCKTASAGVSVTPQVYNVTTAAVAGTGSAVTGTSWTTVTFSITVTSGQNNYRLRMTPGTANVDCFCLGYLEVGR